MNVDEILAGFEPTFRSRLERKVFEKTIAGFSGWWPIMIVVPLVYAHPAYIAYYRATHGGTWLAWTCMITLSVLAVLSVAVLAFLCINGDGRALRRLAEDCGWSIAEFQRMTASFPDGKKKRLLKQLESNLKEAADALA